MAIDPSIILGIKQPQFTQPDPIEQYGKVATLKALIQKEDDDAAMRDVYRQARGDRNSVVNKLLEAGLVQPAMAQQKANLEDEAKRARIGYDTARAGDIQGSRLAAVYASLMRGNGSDESVLSADIPPEGKRDLLSKPPEQRLDYFRNKAIQFPGGREALQRLFPNQVPVGQGDRVTMVSPSGIPGDVPQTGPSLPINVSPNTVATNTVRQQEGALDRGLRRNIAQAGLDWKATDTNTHLGSDYAVAAPVIGAPTGGVAIGANTAPTATPGVGPTGGPAAFRVPDSLQGARDNDRRLILEKELANNEAALAAATDAGQRRTFTDNIAQLRKEITNLGAISPRDASRAASREAAALGSRESTFLNRVLMAGSQVNKDLQNVVELPIRASAGIFGRRQQGKSLFEAGKETLANTMTTQDVQTYNTMATGLQRNLAAIESAGLAPSGSLTHQMNAVLFREGDSNMTKIQKLAQTRQIVEGGFETLLADPRISQSQKSHAREILDGLRKAVPFTPREVIRLQQLQEANPNATMREVLANPGRRSGDGAAPQQALDYLKANPATKEAFKAKYGYLPEGQ